MPSQRRSDWFEYFRRGGPIHGVRIDMPAFKAVSDEARLTERRLLVIIKVHFPNRSFALRRSFQDGPGRVDCAFDEELAADEFAELIGAVRRHPPPGFKTFWHLSANKRLCQRIWGLGQDNKVYVKPNMLARLMKSGAATSQ